MHFSCQFNLNLHVSNEHLLQQNSKDSIKTTLAVILFCVLFCIDNNYDYESMTLFSATKLRATISTPCPASLSAIAGPVARVQCTRSVRLAHTSSRPSARLWEKTAGVMRDREQPRITIHIIQQ